MGETQARAPVSLLDHRLVVVTGKGGTGKTTVAATLGVVAARTGRRTIVAEVARRADVSGALAAPAGEPFAETQLRPGLFHISIDPEDAMEEYLRDQLPSRHLADLLGQSRSFGLLAAATPGLRELLSMGKVWELAQDERRTPGARAYDLVVLDAPATGHGVAALAAPATFARAARTGPVARQGRLIAQWLADPARTAVVAVARAEELAVAETVALAEQLRARLGMELDGVVVNAVSSDRFDEDAEARLRAALTEDIEGASGWAVRRALADLGVARAQRALMERLAGDLGLSPLCLPLAVDPQSGSADLDALAAVIESDGHVLREVRGKGGQRS